MAVASALLVALLAPLVLSGCGSANAEPAPVAELPAATAPTPIPAVAPGGVVTESADMPADVRRALRGGDVMVVAFLIPRAVDDRVVQNAIAEVRAVPAYRAGVRYFVYRVAPNTKFGDLADHLGVDGTPTVAVIGRDRVLANLWNAPIDAAMLRQAIADASARSAATGTTVSPTP
ncbi:MAG: hypothetical protein RIB67_01390 [Miltoncostaeaceae bacterium]